MTTKAQGDSRESHGEKRDLGAVELRSNQAIAISGCMLNQSLMATGCEAVPAMIRSVVGWALENDVGLIPWYCPETIFAGLPRQPKGIEGYRRDGLSEACHEIAGSFAGYLRRQMDGGISVLAIVGVSFSPACSAKRQAYHRNERGLFIEALELALGDRAPPVIDINHHKSTFEIRAVLDVLLHPTKELFDR